MRFEIHEVHVVDVPDDEMEETVAETVSEIRDNGSGSTSRTAPRATLRSLVTTAGSFCWRTWTGTFSAQETHVHTLAAAVTVRIVATRIPLWGA